MHDLHLKITLVDVKKPSVNRTVIVPGGYTFRELHNVIRAAFCFREKGFFEFNNYSVYGDFACAPITTEYNSGEDNNVDDDVDKIVNADFEILEDHIDKFDLLTYFFGDWLLDIQLMDVTPQEVVGPVLVKGSGKIVMEHCGGNLIYMAMVETFNESPNSKAAHYFRKRLNLRKNEMPDFKLDKAEKALINLCFKEIADASAERHKMVEDITSNFAQKMAELLDDIPLTPRESHKKNDKLN